MLLFAADENFNIDIVRGLRRRLSTLDLVRIQNAGLSGAANPVVLAWDASEQRDLLTHDVSTISKHAYDRVQAGLSMPGVVEVSRSVSIGSAIEDIVLLAETSLADEWEGQVLYRPLR